MKLLAEIAKNAQEKIKVNLVGFKGKEGGNKFVRG